MCELFALSSSSPTEVSFSLDEFSKHGGLTNHHRHGWGIAYYQQNTARIIKEAHQASDSACLNFVKDYSIRSQIIMSDTLYATQGEVSFRNTQPFSRELAGKQHVFIHNGDLKEFTHNKVYKNKRFQPMGDTDSEMAFCYLLFKMSELWNQDSAPNLHQRYQVFTGFAEEMRELGLANFIYSDSDYVYVYSDKRIVKDKSNKDATLPGLHVLQRKCEIDLFDTSIKGLNISKKQAQHVVMVSSVPLNDENWIVMNSGDSVVLKNGEIVIDEIL
jgi:glutamine amidotransferase